MLCHLHDNKLRRAAGTLEGKSATESDLDWLEKWVGRNFSEFNKGKWRVRHLGQNNYMQLHSGNQWLQSSFAEKVLGVLVHALNKSKAVWLVPAVCWTVLTRAEGKVRDSFHLFSTCETSSGFFPSFQHL